LGCTGLGFKKIKKCKILNDQVKNLSSVGDFVDLTKLGYKSGYNLLTIYLFI